MEDRNISILRMSQIACVPFIRDTCVNRSKKIIVDFLQFSAMNFNIKNVFINFYERVTKIQLRWRDIRVVNQKRYELLIKMWDREVEIMSNYCSKHKGKNKKLKPLYKKLQVLSPEIKNKMILYYLQKRRHEHVANVYEWVQYQCEKEGKEFKSTDSMEFRITMVGNMNKFLFKGVDNAVLDADYKKEQKALEKTIKIENKHVAEANANKPKAAALLLNQSSLSPTKKGGSIKKSETAKQQAKNKLAYKPLDELYLELDTCPYFFFIPDKRDLQVMIKKATLLKSDEEIDTNSLASL